MGLYCTLNDVKSFMTGTFRGIAKDPEISDMIERAEAEVNAQLIASYESSVPFTVANDIPPVVRWDTAELAYGYLIAGKVGPSEPNKTDYGIQVIARIMKDLKMITDCEKGLYTKAGVLIERDAPCPEGKNQSNKSNTNIIASNTEIESTTDRLIFDLADIPGDRTRKRHGF